MSTTPTTPSSVLNSRIRGNRMNFSEKDQTLISKALAIIWIKTNKKVESCLFERNKATVCCNKSGRFYFDLVEELQEENIKEQEEEKLEEVKKKLNYMSIELEAYKKNYESISSQNIRLQDELRRLQPLHTPGTVDTIVSDSLEIDELDPEQYPESPLSTVTSIFHQDSNSLDLARVVNCDLAINDLTTINTPEEIWINLNGRCFEKFGNHDYIRSDVSISDLTWACSTLPAYLSWNLMRNYHDDIRLWIAKINNFKESEASQAKSPSVTLEESPSPATETASRSLEETELQAPAASTISSQVESSSSLASTTSLQASPPSADLTKSLQTDSSPSPTASTTSSQADLSSPSAAPIISTSQPPAAKTKSAISNKTKPTSRPSAAKTTLATSSRTKPTSRPPAAKTTLATSSRTKTISRPPAAKTTSATSSNTKTISRPPAAKTTLATSSNTKTISPSPAALVAPDAAIHEKRKFVNTSSDEEDCDNNGSVEVFKDKTLNPTQQLLYQKGKKLREILLDSQIISKTLANLEDSQIELMNIMVELSTTADTSIKVVDVETAESRVLQWQKQELECEKLRITSESYNLLHLMSLVQVYEDLIRIGEELKKNSESGIKNVGTWVIGFMRDKLKLNSKAEQRNRLGCNRLRKLFEEGITCAQLAQAGLRKCDFFTKAENYEIFLSQIPSMDTHNSISSSLDELKNNMDVESSSSSSQPKKKKKYYLS